MNLEIMCNLKMVNGKCRCGKVGPKLSSLFKKFKGHQNKCGKNNRLKICFKFKLMYLVCLFFNDVNSISAQLQLNRSTYFKGLSMMQKYQNKNKLYL